METSKRMIRLEIHLTQTQRKRCLGILFRCNVLWNLYTEELIRISKINYKRFKKAKEKAERKAEKEGKALPKNSEIKYKKILLPDNYTFDAWYQDNIKAKDPEFWSKLPSKARRDLIDTRWSAIERGFDFDHEFKAKFRSWYKNPVSSFFFVKNSVRLIDDHHIWIPDIHIIKIKEKWKELIPMDSITSGRIYYDKGLDKWYVCLIGSVPLDYGRKLWLSDEMLPGIGIDLGIKRFMTIYNPEEPKMRQGDYSPYDAHLKKIDSEIAKLNRVIDFKIQWNKIRHGYTRHENGKNIPKNQRKAIYNTRQIQKFRKRIARLYAKARNYRQHCRRVLCNTLVRSQPEFICMENLDVVSMINKSVTEEMGHTFRTRLANASFGLTLREMEWQCRKYSIPFIQVPIKYPSTKTCSHCHSKKETISLSDRIYVCEVCGHIMDRDLNAAKNLYQYGKNHIKFRKGEATYCSSL